LSLPSYPHQWYHSIVFQLPSLLPLSFCPAATDKRNCNGSPAINICGSTTSKYSKERQGVEMKRDKECVARLIQDRANLVARMRTQEPIARTHLYVPVERMTLVSPCSGVIRDDLEWLLLDDSVHCSGPDIFRFRAERCRIGVGQLNEKDGWESCKIWQCCFGKDLEMTCILCSK
jgi:hypothetical protein